MELHKKRPREHRFSKYKGTTYHLGKKGGLFIDLLKEQEFIFK